MRKGWLQVSLCTAAGDLAALPVMISWDLECVHDLTCFFFGFGDLQQQFLIVCAMCHRCIGATNKALAKRRAAEDALRIIAQKEAAVAAAAVAQQAAELQAALAVPGMESTAPVSPSASPPTEDAAAAAPAADVTWHSLPIANNM